MPFFSMRKFSTWLGIYYESDRPMSDRLDEQKKIAHDYVEADRLIRGIDKQIMDLNNQKLRQQKLKEQAEAKLKDMVGNNIQEKCIKVDGDVLYINYGINNTTRVRLLPLE